MLKILKILVAGGAGYIGSHTSAALIERGHSVIIADNLSNSNPAAISAIEKITGSSIPFYNVDLSIQASSDKIFEENSIDAVINFAGLKAVGESVEKPLLYYRNNLCCNLNLLSSMDKYGAKIFIFSSSATVYGEPQRLPVDESHPLSSINPYGATKLITEDIIKDISRTRPEKSFMLLRYFNPAGSHRSLLLGETPSGTPANLMPLLNEAALGLRDGVTVYGNDYPTPDGTGVRDFVHVLDIAWGHVLALEAALKRSGVSVYNLGTGRGYSVLEMIRTYEDVNGVKIPLKFAQRRAGDSASCYASIKKAEMELGYSPKYGIRDICRDSYAFALKNIK